MTTTSAAYTCRTCPLMETLRTLRDRLAARREEIDRAVQAVRQLRDERDRLEASVRRRDARIAALEDELRRRNYPKPAVRS